MFHLLQSNRGSLRRIAALAGVALAATWTAPAAAQEQPNTTAPQQAQRPLTPAQRQLLLRQQQTLNNGANNANANANAARGLLNMLVPGGGASATTQGNAVPGQPNANVPQQAQRPLTPAQRQLLLRQQQTLNNGANNANAANANAARNLLNQLGAGRGTSTPAAPAAAATASGRTVANPAAPALQQRGLGGAASASSRGARPPVQLALADQSKAAARAVQSRNFLGHPGPVGSSEARTPAGNIVRTAADGSVIDVHSPRNGMYIHHALDGSRHIVVDRPDRSRVYASSRGVQYVQHPYVFRGRVLDHRTYYVQGQVFHQFYRPYPYGGTVLDVYATPRYYDASFYQWTTSRFNAPQPFTWEYTSTSPPWFGYYKGYFTPERSYSSPLNWLADYVLAANLAASYKNQPPSGQPPPAESGAGVTPEVKQMVAEEVGRQVRQESAEAQQNAQNRDPAPGAGGVVQELADREPHVFVVASDLDLVDVSGRRCMISEGDVVQVVSGAKPATSTADAVVLASKGNGECERAAQVEIALNDLQEMQNHMRETIDQGMANSNAGKKAASVTPAFVASAPPPDPNAAHELDQQRQIAAAVEG